MPGRVHRTYGKRATRGAQTFGSQAEARYYDELRLRVRAGEVRYFLRQVRIDLPGGVVYRADFLEFLADGTARYVDVKGKTTPLTREHAMKVAIVEDLYPLKIEIERR